ncbi:hypothetical protein ACFOKF_05280 [Sphingobium rhizovicinum]|uniref:Uncharacterized protein n=1 Tax=Sphingobium rhizovicinum TaxID=432308 RepID=A0ABV7NDV0_9SPHN
MVHVFCNLEELGGGLPAMCDMTFEIVETAYDEKANFWQLKFRADATPYEPVGFIAIIPVSGWQEQIDGEENDAFRSFWGPITLCSCGIESDRLLTLLAAYYGISTPRPKNEGFVRKLFGNKGHGVINELKFASRVECFAVGINSDPSLVAKKPVHMKLFLEDGVENGRYAEVFLDIDMLQGFAALNEKDEGYRTDLVHWLSLPGNVMANPYASQA